MLKEWFWIFKKVKTDVHFADHQPALQALVDSGQDIHERDGNGRSAMQYLFAKPFPSTDAVDWIINQPGFEASKETALYPFSLDLPKGCFEIGPDNNMMERLDALMPDKKCSIEAIEQNMRLAKPYLLLLEKFEAYGLTNQYQTSSADYKRRLSDRLKQLNQLTELEDQFTDLSIGFRMMPDTYQGPFQSRIGGAPWLPSMPSILALDDSLKLAFQINFDELGGLNPLLPRHGLLQVFVHDIDVEEGEEPRNGCKAFYWPEINEASWQQDEERMIYDRWLMPTDFEFNRQTPFLYPIRWQAYKQLPDDPKLIAEAVVKLAEPMDSSLYQEPNYETGLMPRMAEQMRIEMTEHNEVSEQPYIPRNHSVIFNMLYVDSGNSVYSIPTDALNGDQTDWSQLTHTYCFD